MFDYLSANAISAMLPNLTFTLPYFGQVDLQKVAVAAIIFISTTFIFWAIRGIILIKIESVAKRIPGNFDDILVAAIRSISAWVYTIVSLYLALQVFDLVGWFEYALTAVLLFSLGWQFIEVATKIISYFVVTYLEKDEDGDGVVDASSATTSNLVTLMSKIVLWSLVSLFILSNLGIEVTSLIAGLGIGGIAVAFALQGVLSDLFASFSIYFDQPFRIGDFVVVGDDSGTVEKIGVKSTRIRTLQGEELVISNTELTSVRVQNFKRMKERRILTEFGITYETPQEVVQQIPEEVTKIFADIENARFHRVHFTSFGDSALIFELVYYVHSAEYVDYLDVQQKLNFALMQRFAEMKIDFAYPTQTIYTKKLA